MDHHKGKIVAALVIVIALVALIALVVVDYNAKRECEANGGHVERYGCYTTLQCTTSTSGTSSFTSCYPVESCKWRCVGARAEQSP